MNAYDERVNEDGPRGRAYEVPVNTVSAHASLSGNIEPHQHLETLEISMYEYATSGPNEREVI